jgi:hypothetical protein
VSDAVEEGVSVDHAGECRRRLDGGDNFALIPVAGGRGPAYDKPMKEPAPTVVPRRTLAGAVLGVFAVPADSIVSAPLPLLHLALAGVEGDRHFGFTRRAGSREPWYPRGTEIRSGRQVTIVSAEEMADVAASMELAHLPAEWIGANLLVGGVRHLSALPSGTRLFFPGKAVLVVEAVNAPCRIAGRAIAERSGNPAHELQFAKVAKGRRGVVASVERAGIVQAGDAVDVRIPEQRLYV